jgi:hypothetical protein
LSNLNLANSDCDDKSGICPVTLSKYEKKPPSLN